ncbi:hypothetical protein CTI12_AA436530 [Artemisia annua]|uniref:Ulp1 protease family, C-terminal catalytic domain-containing protein n=1 Tax=Artemisia annua TaxID=35608 RepID=A0A2U1LYN6_ARTAN|nr:hypothetical protein CTI12_AA436530 [Artemisia annua]
MLTIFQELKTDIDDMLSAGLEKYPRNESLLEVRDWMNRLVKRTTFESSQSEDESPMLMITVAPRLRKHVKKQMNLNRTYRERKHAKARIPNIQHGAIKESGYAEEKRSPGSLRKLYCRTSVTMFFPMMLADEHYYVVYFNLKEPQIHILGNMDHDESIKDRYKKKLVYLRYLFLKFLKENGYPYFETLDKYKVSNVKMPWKTKNNYIDYFCYEAHGNLFRKQIEDLRKKYLTKIQLSDYNENRNVVECEVQEYQSLSLKEKRMLQKMSGKHIAERAIEYFDNEASAHLRKK